MKEDSANKQEAEICRAMAQATETGLQRTRTALNGKALTTTEVIYVMSLIPDKVPIVTALILLLRMVEAMHGVTLPAESENDAKRMH